MGELESVVQMPGLVRKLVIFAAVDGLILQSLDQSTQRSVPNLQIRYTTQGAATLRSGPHSDLANLASLEAHGIHLFQGLLNISSTSYLVAVTRRQQVAQIRGSAVHVITSVGLIPLSSQSEAKRAIEQTKKDIQAQLKNKALEEAGDDDSSADEGNHQSDGHVTDDNSKESRSLSPPYDTARRKSQEENDSVAQDVISKKGQYGRFAERWFSRKGWATERRRAQGMSADGVGKGKDFQPREHSSPDRAGASSQSPARGPEEANTAPTDQASINAQQEARPNNVTSTLLPKLLRTTKMLFASRSFFFSYDYDITRRIGDQKINNQGLPLHRRVDPLVRRWIKSFQAVYRLTHG
ncbi:MAG: hypothetical protein L6R39_001745 [Caloplaca ligustica]|nr:MAG: hypothetical protein L6R39_001745 [Caloplaca ligustica]